MRPWVRRSQHRKYTNSAASPLLSPPPARRWRQAELHWWSAACAGKKHRCGYWQCCVSAASMLLAVLCGYYRPSLSLSSKNHQRAIQTKSGILHLRTESRKVTLKWGNILLKTEKLADVSYCTQQFMLCCDWLKDWYIHKYTQPLITLMAIQRLAERTQQVEPRRFLLPTGRIQWLCINALITRLSYTVIS